MTRILIELNTDDCLLIADLLRARVAHMKSEKQYADTYDEVMRLERGFRKVSHSDHLDKLAVVRVRE